MADPRGNLALHYLRIVDEIRPRWVVWENVPGVLSSSGGRDFGAFLGALGQLGYGWAYRILDAQHFGVPQRRRRVFVVGYIGGWRGAAAVLFDTESLSGNPPPSREAGQRTADTLTVGANQYSGFIGEPVAAYGGGNCESIDVATTLNASPSRRLDYESETFLIKGAAIGRKPENGPQYGEVLQDGSCYTLNCTERHAVAYGFNGDQSEKTRSMGEKEEQSPTLRAAGPSHVSVSFAQNQIGEVRTGDIANTINTNSNASGRNTPMVFQSKASPSNSMNPATIAPSIDVGKSDGLAVYSIMPQNSGKDYKARRVDVAQPLMAGGPVGGNQGGDYVQYQHAVRRLTPRECERLQGFPDNFTRIPYRGKPASQCPDGPRYKALGNSMAVPVMRWIGRRIEMVEKIINAGHGPDK